MTLVAHVADVHLGARRFGLDEIALDVDEAFESLVEELERERPDVLVVAGDLFDRPRPDNWVVSRAVGLLRRLTSRGVRVVVALGEHDYPPRRDKSTPELVGELVDGVYVPQRPGLAVQGMAELVDAMTVEAGGVRVVVAPFFKAPPRERRLLTSKFMEALGARVRGRGWVLAAHLGLAGATHEEDAVLDEASLPPVDYAALGHVHRRIVRPPGEGVPAYAYPGSLVPLSVDEARLDHPRGALLVDLSGDEPSIQEVRVEEPRRHLVVAARVETALREVEKALASAGPRGAWKKKPIVHLTLYAGPRQAGGSYTVRSVVQSISRKLGVIARVSRVVYLEPRREPVEGAGAGAPDEAALLAEYVGGNLEAARLLLELKEALLSGDQERAEALLRELTGPRFEALWRRVLRLGAPSGLGRWM